MNKIVVISIVLFFMASAFKFDKPAYKLYNQDSKEIKYEKMMDDLSKADIVFFGEYHDNPISHWLELQITKDLFAVKDSQLVLGAEMFERDNQLIMNEYLSGLISKSKFEAEARLWPNYKTDYEPLVSFARKNELPFIATNIPRRYASVVFSKGFEGLDQLNVEAKKYIAPLPVQYNGELNCYKSMLEQGAQMGGHMGDNFPKAQAIKDATMAYSILDNFKKGQLFLHFNGSYHSDNFESIIWYIQQAQPDLTIRTITTVTQENIDTLSVEDANRANYIICVPEDITRTH